MVREGKSLPMVHVGVEGVGGPGRTVSGEREEIIRVFSLARQCTHPGQTPQSSEQQSLSFYAPHHLRVMGKEIIRQRKGHSGKELCSSGKPEEWL